MCLGGCGQRFERGRAGREGRQPKDCAFFFFFFFSPLALCLRLLACWETVRLAFGVSTQGEQPAMLGLFDDREGDLRTSLGGFGRGREPYTLSKDFLIACHFFLFFFSPIWLPSLSSRARFVGRRRGGAGRRGKIVFHRCPSTCYPPCMAGPHPHRWNFQPISYVRIDLCVWMTHTSCARERDMFHIAWPACTRTPESESKSFTCIDHAIFTAIVIKTPRARLSGRFLDRKASVGRLCAPLRA